MMGVDIGSTTIKAVIYNHRGEIISMGRTETQVFYRKDSGKRQEALWLPENLWDNVSSAIRSALQKIDGSEKIDGVAVSAFGCDGVPINERGECIYPFISWHDNRTIEQLDVLRAQINDEEVYAITGSKPWYASTILRTMWIKQHKPKIYKKIYKWLMISDYVNYKLCGVIATDYSEASTTLTFDQKKKSWSEKMFTLTDMDMHVYPEPKPSGIFLGEVTEEASKKTELRVGTPVVLGGHDNNVGAFAAGGSSEDSFVTVTGTFESNICFTKEPIMSREGMHNNLMCEKSVVGDEYIFYGFHYAGGMIEWFKRTFFKEVKAETKRNEEVYSLIGSLRSTDISSSGIFVLPNLVGSICPIEDPKSRAVFIGITEKAQRTDFLRAIIEGINYQSLAICDKLQKVANKKMNKIISIGGAANNKFWMQNKADILGKTVEVPNIKEATALGDALLGGIGVGIYRNFKDAVSKVYRGVCIYEPDEVSNNRYQKLYRDIYCRIYDANKRINEVISDRFG